MCGLMVGESYSFYTVSIVWCCLVGVLMWEVFTCGKMPYGRMKNSEVVDRVQKGNILERPKGCDKEIYEVSRNKCKRIAF